MRVIADITRCEGHGLCEATAPDVYALDDEGMVQVLVAEVPRHLDAAARAGARVCPVAALRLQE